MRTTWKVLRWMAGLASATAVVPGASRPLGTGHQGADEMAALRALHRQCAERLQRLDHDLRTPLGTLACALELVRTEQDGPLREESLDVIERQMMRMIAHLETLRSIARDLDG